MPDYMAEQIFEITGRYPGIGENEMTVELGKVDEPNTERAVAIRRKEGAALQPSTPPEPNQPAITKYQNASALRLTKKEDETLSAPIKEEEIEIRPDGIIYMPQVFFRDVLNRTFGRGQWALVREEIKNEGDAKIFYVGSLYVRNCFVSEGIGEAEYHKNNPNESWATAIESAKSDCLTRCCKDLGIGREMWQPRFVEAWKTKYAVKVWVEPKGGGSKVAWRRKDAEPFWNEKGTVQEKAKPGQQKAAPQKESEQPEAKDSGKTEAKADPNKLKNEDAVIPFGPFRNRRFVDVQIAQLKGALDWAKTNNPTKYAEFIKAAEAFITDDGLPFDKPSTEKPASQDNSKQDGSKTDPKKRAFQMLKTRIQIATTTEQLEALLGEIKTGIKIEEISGEDGNVLTDYVDERATKLKKRTK